MEKERTESEEDWSRNLALRSREVERLRGELSVRDALLSTLKEDRSLKGNEEKERLERELKVGRDERDAAKKELSVLKAQLEQAKEAEVNHFILILDNPDFY